MDIGREVNVTLGPGSSIASPNEYELTDPVQRIIIAGFTSLIIVIGIPGNILVMVAVATYKKLQTQTNAFVVNLAVTDLTTCLILPFITLGLLNDVWPLPDFLCTMVGGVVLIGLWGSVINLALIAFNRYYLITRPRFTYDKLYSKRNLAIMVSMAWLVSSAVIIVPTMFGIGGIGFSERYKVCTTISTNKYSDTYATLNSGLVQVPSLVVIVTCYVKIYRFLALRSRELLRHIDKTFEMGKTNENSIAHVASFRRQVQVTKNLFIVICSYICCIMPYAIAALIPHSYPIIPWVSILLVFNSCVNPIIYGLKHPQFQEAFKQLATCESNVSKEQAKRSRTYTISSSLT